MEVNVPIRLNLWKDFQLSSVSVLLALQEHYARENQLIKKISSIILIKLYPDDNPVNNYLTLSINQSTQQKNTTLPILSTPTLKSNKKYIKKRNRKQYKKFQYNKLAKIFIQYNRI